MLVCTLDGDLYPPLEEPTGTDPKSKKKDKDKDKKFVWNHGSKETNIYAQQHFELLVLKTSAIQEIQFALHGSLSHFDFTNPVVLVSSHLPSEEHSQEKISKDCKKEGFDIFSFPPHLPTSTLPSVSLASCLMIRRFSSALLQQDIYIS